jgi:molecular chaperone HscA
MRDRALREARVEAERMILATRSALAADSDLLSDAERAEIDQRIESLKVQALNDDAAVIDAAVKSLADSTEAFAAERMNRGIRSALSGRRVEEV